MRYRVRFCPLAITLLLLFIAAAGLLAGFLLKFSIRWRILLGSRVCACSKCLTEGDSCFTELVNEAPEPFLSGTLRPPPDAFKCRLMLNFSWIKKKKKNPKNIQLKEIQMFQMFPPFPNVAAPSPDRCKTCAVVGNSHNLKGSDYGSLIDSHDIVIRMNRAKIESYEGDVGAKTTHHIMYPHSAVNLENNTSLVFFPFKIRDFEWLFKNCFLISIKTFLNSIPKSKTIANKDLVVILNPAFMKYVHQAWLGSKGRWASTGFMTVVLSLYMCDQVNVFGFGADKNGNWSHYFEKLRKKRLKTGVHPGKHEFQVIQKLHKKKKIRLYSGH
uniref:ST3 beta-galactoside alpha-2,3-sialyltransferase 1 n=1 Tax=Salarias fasciatus TaxID=181472 RepID=A0A672GIL2_SALFA